MWRVGRKALWNIERSREGEHCLRNLRKRNCGRLNIGERNRTQLEVEEASVRKLEGHWSWTGVVERQIQRGVCREKKRSRSSKKRKGIWGRMWRLVGPMAYKLEDDILRASEWCSSRERMEFLASESKGEWWHSR